MIGLSFANDLLTPLNVSSYLANHYEVKPAVLRRKQSQRDYFSSLLSIHNIGPIMDVLVLGLGDDGSDILVTGKGKEKGKERGWNLVRKTWDETRKQWSTLGIETNSNLSLDTETAKRLFFSEGYTLVVNKVQKLNAKVAFAVDSLQAALGHSVSANLYATIMSSMMSSERSSSSSSISQGFAAHFDWMDSIIVQVAGCKRWRIYDTEKLPNAFLPTPDTVFELTQENLALLPVTAEFDLTAGSVLTIPRGWVHEASTNCSSEFVVHEIKHRASLHLTFGVEAPIATTFEILLHHMLVVESNTNIASRLWGHLLLHSTSTKEEVLRRSLPAELLNINPATIGEAVFSSSHIDMLRAAVVTARQGLLNDATQIRAAKLATVLLGDNATECHTFDNLEELGTFKSPTYIIPFLAPSLSNNSRERSNYRNEDARPSTSTLQSIDQTWERLISDIDTLQRHTITSALKSLLHTRDHKS